MSLFGTAAAAPGAIPGQQMQQTGPEAQILCLELAKRMEALYTSSQQGFVAYTYSFSDNPQVLMQHNSGQFNPQVHVDAAKWMQAVQNNPDPRSCYPEPLVGLQALEARIMGEQKAFEECTNQLDALKAGFGNLKDRLHTQSLLKLEECRQRHKELSRKLLEVIAMVETYAVQNGAARRSPYLEAQLEDRFASLEESECAPAHARARLEELWVVLRGLQQHGPPSGGAARLSDADAEKTLLLTASQGELLESLQEELARRKRDTTQFETAIARFAAIPPGTQPI